MGQGRTRYQVANLLAAIGHVRAAREFQAALREPEAAQRRILARILQANAGSAFGRQHAFSRLKAPGDYRLAVPPADHDALSPWIDRALRGEAGVLTAEPVLVFEKTSGSTRAAKYIPYTASLRAEFQRATGAWLFDLWRAFPGIRLGGAYWSVSPAGREREITPGGHPVGFADDTEYFDPLTRWVLNQLLVVPGTVAHAGSMDEVRHETLRRLLATEDLALISVWNPSFLTMLLRAIDPLRERLISALPPSRARLIAGGFNETDWGGVWPRLALISCWADSSAALFVPEIRRLFPQVPIQGKGLLSTEGVVSIPLAGQPGAALAVTSHFLEFVPEDADPAAGTMLAHELEAGGRYTVLLTTGGGLYRYATHDVVEVVGRIQRTPLVRFVGRQDHVSDLCGEKLAAMHVERVLGELLPPGTVFALLAPELPFASETLEAPPGDGLSTEPGASRSPGADDALPHYVLFAEITPFATHSLPDPGLLDAKLRENPHYAYCRDLGQLGPVRVRAVQDGQRKYLAGCEALGQKPGNIKPVALHRSPGWSKRFS